MMNNLKQPPWVFLNNPPAEGVRHYSSSASSSQTSPWWAGTRWDVDGKFTAPTLRYVPGRYHSAGDSGETWEAGKFTTGDYEQDRILGLLTGGTKPIWGDDTHRFLNQYGEPDINALLAAGINPSVSFNLGPEGESAFGISERGKMGIRYVRNPDGTFSPQVDPDSLEGMDIYQGDKQSGWLRNNWQLLAMMAAPLAGAAMTGGLGSIGAGGAGVGGAGVSGAAAANPFALSSAGMSLAPSAGAFGGSAGMSLAPTIAGVAQGAAPAVAAAGLPSWLSQGTSLLNSIGGLMRGPVGSIVRGGVGSRQQREVGHGLQEQYNRWLGEMQPYLDRLRETYENPQAYLSSPEFTSGRDIYQNQIDREAARSGRLANPTDREVLLQQHAMKQMEDHRKGIVNSMGISANMAGMAMNPWMQGMMARNTAMNPWFAAAEQLSRVDWTDVGKNAKNIWDIISGWFK